MRTYSLLTLGCKVNQYESQTYRERLGALGLRPAEAGQTPDLALINTCAVTHTACRKSRQLIRRAARNSPVIVIGCYAAAEAQALAAIRGVAAVITHQADPLSRLATVVARLASQAARHSGEALQPADRQPPEPTLDSAGATDGCRAVHHWPNQRLAPLILQESSARTWGRINFFAGRHRAFLKVQDGCDAYCTYCIIPRLRGQIRHQPIHHVLEEARRLIAAGFRELVLTGIFLGAYGQPTALRRRWQQPSQLPALVDAVARLPGVARLRLSSLEPGDVTDELLTVLASHPACVPHLHLPLQSGSAAVLRRMNRQYTIGEYLRMIERCRNSLDQPAITTDLLVGFPGEMDQDFQATCKAVRRVGFAKIHAFPFSPRAGTAAQRWKHQFVPDGVVRQRMQHLAELEKTTVSAFRRQLLGRTERVLVERAVGGRCTGRADRYFPVHFAGPPDLEGRLVHVRLRCLVRGGVHAELLGNPQTIAAEAS